MIRFYKDALDILLNDPTMFTDRAIYGRLHSRRYVFDELHTLSELDYEMSNSVLLFNATVINPPGLRVYDCENIAFPNVPIDNSPLGQIYSVIFYNEDQPLFILSDIEGLPTTSLGGTIEVSVSSGRDKLFSIVTADSSDYGLYKSGSHFVTTSKPIGRIEQPVNQPYRSGRDIHPVEALPKKSLTGKRGTYKDLSMFGTANPLTGDISSVIDEHAISQSLRTILLTDSYERPFSSMGVAGNINSWLFENIDYGTMPAIELSIKTAINNYEPRITLQNVSVIAQPERNALNVLIAYRINATNDKHTFSLLLNRS